MDKILRIVTWNASGLMQHIAKLEIFLNIKKIDICLILKTNFTRMLYVKIRGYCCYHATRLTEEAKERSAIFVKENVKYYEEIKIEEEAIQVTTIKIQLNSNKEYNVSAIYCPSLYNFKENNYVELFKSLGHYFIIEGDFNARKYILGFKTYDS